MRQHWIMTALLACTLLQGCSDERLPPLARDAKILAFGDSLTAGLGTSPANSYPSVLAQLSGRRVINAGVSGEVTADGLQRLGPLLDEERPQLLILLEGGNDILRNLDLNETRANLQQMIELARARNIPVVLIGVPQKSLFSSSAPLYSELAERYQLPFARSMIAELLRSPGYKSDAVHFNAAGYREMAEQIQELLEDEGAL